MQLMMQLRNLFVVVHHHHQPHPPPLGMALDLIDM